MKTALAATAALGLLLLTACGTADPGSTATDPAGRPSPGLSPAGEMPTSVPPPEGEVVGLGTVMDTGQPELCLGPVAESFPPQCRGIPLVGWDWDTVGRTFERSGETRWGSYAVTGTYDGTTMTVTSDPVSSALYDPAASPAAPPADPFVTSCPEPQGGWGVVDPDRVGFEDQDAMMAAAVQLPGYAGSFVDQSQVLEQPDTEQAGEAAGTIINVLVTEDAEGAEAALRKVWGGALCVALAQHTEQELIDIQDGLFDLPGLLSSGAQLDAVSVDVVWDDGSLQAWADAAYGEGLVVVRPALREVG